MHRTTISLPSDPTEVVSSLVALGDRNRKVHSLVGKRSCTTRKPDLWEDLDKRCRCWAIWHAWPPYLFPETQGQQPLLQGCYTPSPSGSFRRWVLPSYATMHYSAVPCNSVSSFLTSAVVTSSEFMVSAALVGPTENRGLI